MEERLYFETTCRGCILFLCRYKETKCNHCPIKQWWRNPRVCQGKFPGRNTSALAAALAVKSGNNKMVNILRHKIPPQKYVSRQFCGRKQSNVC